MIVFKSGFLAVFSASISIMAFEVAAQSDISSAYAPGELPAMIFDAERPEKTLITNVNIFDGVNDGLKAGSVLVEGSLISEISEGTIDAPDAVVIDGGGRTLMPGMIDGHAHVDGLI